MVNELTNKEYNTNFSMPIIYGTRAYFPMRGQYRYLVQNLVINPNEENWDKWFKFNLNREEDTLMVLEDKVKEYTKRIG